MEEDQLQKAHDACSYHSEEIARSELCGCFHCLTVFQSPWISEWIDAGKTALCPACGIDSVIPATAGYPLNEEFLRAMYNRWFHIEGLKRRAPSFSHHAGSGALSH